MSHAGYPRRAPPSDLERIFAALEASGARYLEVGGVAVVLHGHLRFTADLDLVLALDPPNVEAALSALEGLGYRARAGSPPLLRRSGTARGLGAAKGMTMFSLWSEELPGTEIDLFVAEPIPFEAAWRRRLRADLGGTVVNVTGVADLIDMKRQAGRAQDLADVQALEALEREGRGRD